VATRLTADSAAVKGVIDIGPIQLPMAVVTLLGTLVIMGFLDWVLLLITLSSFLVALGIIAGVVVSLRRKYLAIQQQVGGLTEHFVAALEALTVIKAYRAEDRVSAGLADRARRIAGIEISVSRQEALMVPVINLGQQIALVAVILGGGARMLAGHLTLAIFVAFLLYLLQLAAPLLMAVSGVSGIQTGLVARRRFDELFALPTEDQGGVAAREPAGAPDPAGGPVPAVRFERVSFAYDQEPVLREVDLQVGGSGLTAIVGPSGAGKTTVLALVERLMDPDSGRIEVFGRDSTGWTLPELRGRIAYVDQACTLLRDTVRNNLTLGRTGPTTEQELADVLDRVGLSADVARLPQGLDTVLGGASDLSGGQRQRLALARAILAEAELVLLDEPSSQLDSGNEQRLREIIDDIARDRAVLVVAHRLSTIQHADQVIVLDSGQVLGQGRHEALLRSSAEYAELVSGQTLAIGEPAPPDQPVAGEPSGRAAVDRGVPVPVGAER
jgi:ABC-type multidrug transport system fused ATPase/permease subunit